MGSSLSSVPKSAPRKNHVLGRSGEGGGKSDLVRSRERDDVITIHRSKAGRGSLGDFSIDLGGPVF